MLETGLSYRPHIDGMRAIAVIAVVLFHLQPEVFVGGYLGVDIFFVISGFVITQSLYKNYLEKGKINIVEFYVRRFKRLYPALVTMILGTTVVYTFFGFLWDTNLYLKSALTSLFATSNLYFLFSGDNYFHQDLINPLLHTWSLGVEEQFYFIYPLLLAVAFFAVRKYKISLSTLALVFLSISVFLYAVFFTNTGNILGDFYFPFARFWELGAGCALFFFSRHFAFTLFTKVTAVVALTALVALQFIEGSVDDIRISILVTVLASSALLYAGINGGGVVMKFLGHAAITYIGRISYSLYLWHLPVIYLANLYLDTVLFLIFAPILSVLLAMFSYHIIETPLRYSERLEKVLRSSFRFFPYAVVVGVVTVLFIGQGQVRTYINHGFNAYGDSIKSVNYIESNFNLGARIQPAYSIGGKGAADCSFQSPPVSLNKLGLREECYKHNNYGTLFYLTGDSHALHFVSMLDASSVVENLYFIEFPRQAIVSENPREFSEERSLRVLKEQRDELIRLNDSYENVYYVSSLFLSPWQDQKETIQRNLKRYIETLEEHATLIFIAPTPVFAAGPESCVLLGKHCTTPRSFDLDRRNTVYTLLTTLEDTYDNVYVYDAFDVLCPKDKCINYDRENNFLAYMDQDHLSVEQSILLAPHFDAWFANTFGTSQESSSSVVRHDK